MFPQIPLTSVWDCTCPDVICLSVTERHPTCRKNVGYDPYNHVGRRSTKDPWAYERLKANRSLNRYHK